MKIKKLITYTIYISISFLIILLFGFFIFLYSTIFSYKTDDRYTDAVVVFTGSPGRLNEGVKILEKKLAKKMLVTGVNSNTIHKTEEWLSNLTSQYDCCIELGVQAQNTEGNARETLDWIKANKFTSIRLVTANYHMPRSVIELKRFAEKKLTIIKHPTNDHSSKKNKIITYEISYIILFFREYLKYLYSLKNWIAYI
ncbi:YdcF family protein [Alphaproteobacteria bacterium]|nr:YdcF family protein [Alphaproteobacteria bacterium]